MAAPETAEANPAASRSLRRRLVRHYLPLALATAGAMALFLNLDVFDANQYPPPDDIFTDGIDGAWPDGDYPPQTDQSDQTGRLDHERPDHNGATSSPGQDAPATSVTSVPGTVAGDHTGPPAGGHGPPQPDVPTTLPVSAATEDLAGEGDEHAGDLDTVLRMRRYSTATGYVATAMLGLTLLIGPVNLLRRRRNPLSSYLRRDIGIWTGITSGVHVVFGFLVRHGDGELLGYFFEPGDRTQFLANSFGLANWTGLLGLLVVAGLVAVSSDAALRALKARRWKQLQRLNYALIVLVAFHALFYGALWRLTSPYTVVLGIVVVAVVVAQITGVLLWRRRHARPATRHR